MNGKWVAVALLMTPAMTISTFAAVLALCARGLPSVVNADPLIARNMTPVMADRNLAFQHRLDERFPVGSSKDAMIRELISQGFKVRAPGDWAIYSKKGFPCRYEWALSWQDLEDKLAVVRAKELPPRCM